MASNQNTNEDDDAPGLSAWDTLQHHLTAQSGVPGAHEATTSTNDPMAGDNTVLSRLTREEDGQANRPPGNTASVNSDIPPPRYEESGRDLGSPPRVRRTRNSRPRVRTAARIRDLDLGLDPSDDAESSASAAGNLMVINTRQQSEQANNNILLRQQMQALELKGLELDGQAIAQCIEALDFKPCAALLYQLQPSDTQTDVWPDVENFARTPAQLAAISSKSWTALKSRTPSHQTRGSLQLNPTTSNAVSPTWPQSGKLLPLEVYDIIVQHLCRDDIKALRLTCKTVEYSVSRFLFTNVVVNFNDEIYGILRQRDQSDLPDANDKGKSRAKRSVSRSSNLYDRPWTSEKSPNIYNGHVVDVFRSFGAHMKKFGMTFEVDEQILASLPDKNSSQALRSYWGEYDWPYVDYQRFKDIARIERTADDIPVMTQAFSSLKRVEELSLSVDAGTGWLQGPDVSLYHRIFHEPSRIFEQHLPGQNRRARNQQKLWTLLKCICRDTGYENIANAKVHHESLPFSTEVISTILDRNVASHLLSGDAPRLELASILDFARSEQDLDDLKNNLSVGTRLLSITETVDNTAALHLTGILAFDDTSDSDSDDDYAGPLLPVALTTGQTEWLIETQWAQRAFISSYILAIMDNESTFRNVQRLNLSKVSTSYLNMLNRDDFWDSLPLLKHLTILVIGEWQAMERDEAGYIEAKAIAPSSGCSVVENFLTDIIAPRRNIKALNIGWTSGGEHARGAFDRNQHVLPSPLMPSRWRTSGLADAVVLNDEMIVFPFLEHLTLTNSWIVPSVLKLFVQAHCTRELKSLSLHSVSLTKNLAGLDRVLVLERYFSSLLQQAVDIAHSPSCPPQKVMSNMSDSMSKFTAFQILKIRQRLQRLDAESVVAECSRNRGTTPAPEPPHAPFELHRDGSWPDVLDAISPGMVAADMLQGRGKTSVLLPGSQLRSIELVSCGYCNITPPNVQFETQHMVLTPRPGSAMARRSTKYSKKMLPNNRDEWFGTISQYLSQVEDAILHNVWGMQIGWTDEEARFEVFYDGFMEGGVGRFSGRIEAVDDHIPAEERLVL